MARGMAELAGTQGSGDQGCPGRPMTDATSLRLGVGTHTNRCWRCACGISSAFGSRCLQASSAYERSAAVHTYTSKRCRPGLHRWRQRITLLHGDVGSPNTIHCVIIARCCLTRLAFLLSLALDLSFILEYLYSRNLSSNLGYLTRLRLACICSDKT